MKNPSIAAVLSFIIPGSGLVYAGSILKGVFVFLVCSWLVYVVTNGEIWGIFAFLVVWIWNMYEAKRMCEYQNKKLQTEKSQSL